MIQFDKRIYESGVFEKPIYESWLKNVNEREILEEALTDRFSEWFDQEWNVKRIKIIDIGCGSGSASKRLFRILDNKNIKYSYLGIDPYKEQLERFEKEITIDKNKKLLCSTLDEFKTEEKFDLAFVIHSLYYVEDIEKALNKIMIFADKAIVVHHGENGINKVQKKFKKYVKKGPNIIGTYKDILVSLEKLGIKYDYDIYEATVNVSHCKNPKDKEGINMIKFFLERSKLSKDIIIEVSKWFKEEMDDTMKHDFALIITK
ncbi:class I SAM-dependent methyltransferase [Candidatus Pacearchaeota archaeon]|nr:class I SAM-dependent methyltransferase [Candidatus Pacearchaeota archaeon]